MPKRTVRWRPFASTNTAAVQLRELHGDRACGTNSGITRVWSPYSPVTGGSTPSSHHHQAQQPQGGLWRLGGGPSADPGPGRPPTPVRGRRGPGGSYSVPWAEEGVAAGTVPAPGPPVRRAILGARLGAGFVVAVSISTICRLSCRSRSRRRRLQPCYRPPRGQTAPRACSQMPCPPSRASSRLDVRAPPPLHRAAAAGRGRRRRREKA